MFCTNGNLKKTDSLHPNIAVDNGRLWKEDLARERWKLLAKALSGSHQRSNKNISVRRFSSFGLIGPITLENKAEWAEECWVTYGTRIGEKVLSVDLRLLHRQPTAAQLMGFNNTGNVCVWPSEEVLAWYLLPRAALFADKSVLELGGGMTCLAGVYLAKYSKAKKLHLTDGNAFSVDNVKCIVEKNNLPRTLVSQLDWGEFAKTNEKYDVILCADCLFFDETRWCLVETLWHCLAPSGVALIMAPARGGTLHAFLQSARTRGFVCTLHAQYCDAVWQRHLQFRETRPEYDENLHYPLLLLLTKPLIHSVS